MEWIYRHDIYISLNCLMYLKYRCSIMFAFHLKTIILHFYITTLTRVRIVFTFIVLGWKSYTFLFLRWGFSALLTYLNCIQMSTALSPIQASVRDRNPVQGFPAFHPTFDMKSTWRGKKKKKVSNSDVNPLLVWVAASPVSLVGLITCHVFFMHFSVILCLDWIVAIYSVRIVHL